MSGWMNCFYADTVCRASSSDLRQVATQGQHPGFRMGVHNSGRQVPSVSLRRAPISDQSWKLEQMSTCNTPKIHQTLRVHLDTLRENLSTLPRVALQAQTQKRS